MVTRAYLCDTSADAMHDPGALMTQHHRERHGPGPYRQVGMADPGAHNADRNLIISRWVR